MVNVKPIDEARELKAYADKLKAEMKALGSSGKKAEAV